jgi:hypothetical protein
MNTHKALIPAALAVLFLAACSTGGGIGDILGGGSPNASNYEIRGTVDHVDTASRSIYLTNVTGYTSMLSSGGGDSVRVYFDDRTPVEYQGQTYRPQDLERGDQVAVRVDESGNQLHADSMTVIYNAGGTGSGSTFPTYGSSVRGTVRHVDSSRRTIEVDRGSGSPVIVEFDTNTPVYFSNQTYRVTDLERGDEVDIRVRDLGSGRVLATDITVTRNVSGGGTFGSGSGSSQLSTFRGTVRFVDTARRTIELESTTWISGFNTGAGTGMSTMIVQYDTNTGVDVQGRLHPVDGLERGDVVEVHARSLGGSSYMAERLVLVRDVRR